MAIEIPIWDDNAGAVSGSTAFGYYDGETSFVTDAKKFARFASRRLGYPIVDVELQSGSFYTAMEEAIMEYAYHVNNSNIRDNLLNLKGIEYTSSVSQKNINSNLNYILSISDEYGTELGVGGNVSWKTGSIELKEDVQRYDLNALFRDEHESGEEIEIRKVFYKSVPASMRFYNPQLNADGTSDFGFGDNAGYYNTTHLLTPMYHDALKMQQIEFNDMLRKSAYSFRLINNQLVIFPVPDYNYNLYFEYTVKSDKYKSYVDENTNKISDYSNIPYDRISYSNINDVGKNWIRKYALSITKQMLGLIRSKYSSIPIPNSEITLNGDTLLSESENEMENLITNLKEMLDQLSNESLLERKSNETNHMSEQMSYFPLKIYTG